MAEETKSTEWQQVELFLQPDATGHRMVLYQPLPRESVEPHTWGTRHRLFSRWTRYRAEYHFPQDEGRKNDERRVK